MKKVMYTSFKSDKLLKKSIEYYNSIKESFLDEEVLVFILHRQEKTLWKNVLDKNFSIISINSFFSFMQKEITKYWDFITDYLSSGKISSPTFLTYESSQTLMVKLVDFFKSKGYLKEISFSNEELSQKMLSNLYYMSTGNVSYTEFSERIKNQELTKSLFSDKTYNELQKLINVYMERTMKEGVFDYPSTIYVFFNILLKNENYIYILKKYKKVVVTNYESQISILDDFLEFFNDITVFKSEVDPVGVHFPNGFKKKSFLEEFETISLDEKENSFLDDMYDNLFLEKNKSLENENVYISYSFENKEEISKYILKILETISINKNIAIISPVRNLVLDYTLKKYCDFNNINYLNFDKNERFIDNPFIYSIITLSTIYFKPENIYLNHDEIRQLLVLFFKIDYFFASTICKKIKITNDFFIEIKKYQNKFSQETLDVIENTSSIFLKEFSSIPEFLEEIVLIVKENNERKNIKKIIDLSYRFIKNISIFTNLKRNNDELLEIVRKGIKETETLEEINEKHKFNGVILCTPFNLLTYNKKIDISIFIDLENNLWNMNFFNIIQNPFILNNSFKTDEIFTINHIERYKKEELFNLISRIFYLTTDKMFFLGSNSEQFSLFKSSIIK